MSRNEPPVFFFSHSRREREHSRGAYLDKFFKDLDDRLFLLSTIENPGVMDTMAVDNGDDWDEVLTDALRTCRVLVAAFSPLYFDNKKSKNIGKELHIFLRRSEKLSVDVDGALKGVENMVAVQWQPKNHYQNDKGDRGRVPTFLSLISDVSKDDGTVPERTAAIKHYKVFGMVGSVDTPHYDRILDLFADRIWNMPPLRTIDGVSFATAQDAYSMDWKALLNPGQAHDPGAGTPATASPLAAQPQPLSSLVVFHVTAQPFTPDVRPVAFAEQLIQEPETDDGANVSVFGDIRAAAAAENIAVFHAADASGVPTSADALIARLKALSQKGILTAVLLDGELWAQRDPNSSRDVIDDITQSAEWSGPIFVQTPQPNAVSRMAANRRIVDLPTAPAARIDAVRQAIRDARGRAMSATSLVAANADQLPILVNSTAKAG